jgi:hypothetical protein
MVPELLDTGLGYLSFGLLRGTLRWGGVDPPTGVVTFDIREQIALGILAGRQFSPHLLASDCRRLLHARLSHLYSLSDRRLDRLYWRASSLAPNYEDLTLTVCHDRLRSHKESRIALGRPTRGSMLKRGLCNGGSIPPSKSDAA